MRRYELSDEQWEQIKELFPEKAGGKGRPARPSRQILNGIFWILYSGASWRDLPERYGPWKTVYHRFTQWRKDGTYDKVLSHLQMKLDQKGLLDWTLFGVDSTSVKASKAAAGARKKKPRKIPPTKP
jgi:transposase